MASCVRRLLFPFIISILSFWVASCGFRTLHSEARNHYIFSSIKLGSIEAEQDYLLKRYLENALHLNSSGTKSVLLDVKTLKSITSSIIKQDNAISGQNIKVTAHYFLRNLETNELIKRGVVSVIVSANLVDSPLASESNIDKAYSDALKEISRILKSHIAIALTKW